LHVCLKRKLAVDQGLDRCAEVEVHAAGAEPASRIRQLGVTDRPDRRQQEVFVGR
jgi:hypothetical protein